MTQKPRREKGFWEQYLLVLLLGTFLGTAWFIRDTSEFNLFLTGVMIFCSFLVNLLAIYMYDCIRYSNHEKD